MSDDLLLPQVPEPKPEDPEDVSWALSTAEAMWARGDHGEGIKWVRRAAEAASEAEQDERALELAKTAADLAGMISRQVSAPSIDLEEIVPISDLSEPPPVPGKKLTKGPTALSVPPKLPAPKAGLTPTRSAPPASRPPAPLPSRTSQAPAVQPSPPPRAAKPAPAAAPKAAARAPVSKRNRRSRENLEVEARAAANLAETATYPTLDTRDTRAAKPAWPSDSTEPLPHAPVPRRENVEPTQVSHVDDIVKAGSIADAWDASPTESMTGDELPPLKKLSLQTLTRGTPSRSSPPAPTNVPLGTAPPTTVVGPALRMPVAADKDKHDPAVVTTQAVRVVVWRDANGVHVAPAGTAVTAITLDAVLVALEPNTDLTAWLGRRT